LTAPAKVFRVLFKRQESLTTKESNKGQREKKMKVYILINKRPHHMSPEPKIEAVFLSKENAEKAMAKAKKASPFASLVIEVHNTKA
jgi:hypothetical protein